jgi:hypothetical protein
MVLYAAYSSRADLTGATSKGCQKVLRPAGDSRARDITRGPAFRSSWTFRKKEEEKGVAWHGSSLAYAMNACCLRYAYKEQLHVQCVLLWGQVWAAGRIIRQTLRKDITRLDVLILNGRLWNSSSKLTYQVGESFAYAFFDGGIMRNHLTRCRFI